MNELSNKVYNLLKENGVEDIELLDKLSLIYSDLKSCLWENISISPEIFYSLKDIVWYNLEHLPNGGEEKGLSSLKYLGTEFPNLIYCCNDKDIIDLNDIPALLNELELIIKKWDANWKLVSLYTKSNTGWEKDSKAIIYDSRYESPSKYGYNVKYNSILDANGKSIKKYDFDTVLCALDTNIGEYVNGQIVYNVLLQLIQICKKSLTNKRDIKVNFE